MLLFAGVLAFVLLCVYIFDKRRQRKANSFIGLGHDPSAQAQRAPPEKQPPPQTAASASPTYEDIFPPDRRFALAEINEDGLQGPGPSLKELSQIAPNYDKCTPDKDVSDAVSVADHTTATGFTVAEIKRLGDFPDYATLSGVPLPEPRRNFDISKAAVRPYRPFRWPYFQTMSLMKLDTDYWLELEKSYVSRIKQRQSLYAKHGDRISQALPGSELAAKELMEIAIQFLCARYPMYFHLSDDKRTLHNGILKTTTDLKKTKPLMVLLNNVPEDFAIVVRSPETGLYSFRGGVICSAIGWSLGSKIGLKIHEIHEPVPDYKEKMQFSMDRFFAKMPTDKPIQRGSWGLSIDDQLFVLPDEETSEEKRKHEQNTATLERCCLRVDWQTLRRLPLSGAIVFNFKCLSTPVTEFRDEPYIPSLLLKNMYEGKKSIKEYKEFNEVFKTEHLVAPAMEKYAGEQVANGVVEADWEPHTLDDSPFFPYWEDKWQRQEKA